MIKKWQLFHGLKTIIDDDHSYDAIITRKWLYNHPRLYLCKKGGENWPNIPKIRRFVKDAKLAISQ